MRRGGFAGLGRARPLGAGIRTFGLARPAASSRAVALTFDDGPSEGTPQILDILARYRAPATFFQCGANVERLPDVARAVSEAGHAIGNHSHAHPLFCFRSRRFIETDLRRAQEAIERHTGVAPALVPRALRGPLVRAGAAQRRLDLTGVMWTAIGYDWSLKADAVVERLARARGERRYSVSSRRARASRQAGYRRNGGSRPAPGSHVAGPGLSSLKR